MEKVKLFINRVESRIKISWHSIWPWNFIGVLLVILSFLYLQQRSVFDRFFYDIGADSYLGVVGFFSALAVFIIALRQEKIESASQKLSFIPYVVRDTPSGYFSFNSDSLTIFKQRVKSKTIYTWGDILRISIKNNAIATDVKGYVIYKNYFYRLSVFSVPSTQTGPSQNIQIKLFNQYTWATKNHPLYFVLDGDTRKKITYSENYYCITFSDILGNSYFLEEDTNYQMLLRDLGRSRPKFSRDYISWLK